MPQYTFQIPLVTPAFYWTGSFVHFVLRSSLFFKRKGEKIVPVIILKKLCRLKSRKSVKCPLILSMAILGWHDRQTMPNGRKKMGRTKTGTNLLLRVLHSSHGPRGPALEANWIPLWTWGTVGTSRVRTALLRLRMRVAAHPIQLRSLHHHGIHRAALWRNRRRSQCIKSLFITKAESLLCWHIHKKHNFPFENIKNKWSNKYKPRTLRKNLDEYKTFYFLTFSKF